MFRQDRSAILRSEPWLGKPETRDKNLHREAPCSAEGPEPSELVDRVVSSAGDGKVTVWLALLCSGAMGVCWRDPGCGKRNGRGSATFGRLTGCPFLKLAVSSPRW